MSAASVKLTRLSTSGWPSAEHILLKAYCASLYRSMQDVLRDFALMEIQKQHNFCRIVRSFIEEHGIDQAPRAKKHCGRYSCYSCRHAYACKDGGTDLLFIPRHELREMVTEEFAYILNFDGSSIEAPTQVG